MGLTEALPDGSLALDTSVFIYFLERHPEYGPLVRDLFTAADRGDRQLVTSTVTLLELLVVPYRSADLALASRYEALLTRSRGLYLQELDRPVLRAAAQLRAAHGLRTPDALQLAAALAQRCVAFVTNDRRLPSLRHLPVVQLSDHT